MRADLAIIESFIPRGARVLDLGCADGALLRDLALHKAVVGYGVEISPDNVVRCIENEVNVLQVDLEQGLQGFGDQYFDVAILSQTIQAIHTTEATLREMMRVAKEAIVTLPNFGYWKQRAQLMMGRMPVSKALPYQWFNTPNVRYCTIDDFDLLCRALGFAILDAVVLDDEGNKISVLQNLRGAVAVFRLGKD